MHQLPQPILTPRELLLRAWPDIFPGLDRVVVLSIGADGSSDGLELLRKGQQYQLNELLTTALADQLAQIAREQPGYLWLTPGQVPFEEEARQQRQLDIFSEEQHVVMQLRMKVGRQTDCFYLYFRGDQSNFGVSRLQGQLDTARKALIGTLLFRFTRFFYQSSGQFKDYIHQFTNVTKQLLSGQNSESQNPPLSWVDQWSQDQLEQLGAARGIQLRLSKAALERLATAPDYRAAKSALEQAARFALMLTLSNEEQDEVLIEAPYLVFPAVSEPDKSATNSLPAAGGRMEKTRNFLDQLEDAAAELARQGEDLTGAMVGKLMERPITAPAITDALRKNKKRILLLLEQNPQNWPIIRQYFRPLINLLEREKELRQIG